MAPLRSVVLAGGGTGGHIYPLLAFADCLRRHDPTLRITCLGSPKGLENELIPAARLRPAAGPGVPAAPVGQHEPGPHPGPDVRVDARRPARSSTRSRPTSWSASAGTSSVPAYLAAWRRDTADRDPRGERAAGRGQPDGHAVHQERRGRLPVPAEQAESLRGRPGGRGAAAHGDHHAGPAGAAPAGARPLRAATRTCRRCSSSARRRAPARSTWRWPARPRRSPRAGIQVLHVHRAPATSRSRSRPTCRSPYVTRAVPRRHGAGLRRGRPDAVPGRRDDRRRDDRGRPAGDLCAAAVQ